MHRQSVFCGCGCFRRALCKSALNFLSAYDMTELFFPTVPCAAGSVRVGVRFSWQRRYVRPMRGTSRERFSSFRVPGNIFVFLQKRFCSTSAGPCRQHTDAKEVTIPSVAYGAMPGSSGRQCSIPTWTLWFRAYLPRRGCVPPSRFTEWLHGAGVKIVDLASPSLVDLAFTGSTLSSSRTR